MSEDEKQINNTSSIESSNFETRHVFSARQLISPHFEIDQRYQIYKMKFKISVSKFTIYFFRKFTQLDEEKKQQIDVEFERKEGENITFLWISKDDHKENEEVLINWKNSGLADYNSDLLYCNNIDMIPSVVVESPYGCSVGIDIKYTKLFNESDQRNLQLKLAQQREEEKK
eukprot:2862_1